MSGADTSIAEMSPGALTDVRNVRVTEGYVAKSEGRSIQLATAVPPYGVLAGATDASNFQAYMGLDKVHAWLGTEHEDITRISGDYTGEADDYWNWCLFNGLPILNNGVDVPQLWSQPTTSTPLVDLPNWPSTVRAKVIRPFKNYLVALYITKSGAVFPRMVKWSHSASAGVPSSWDETNAALDAGENVLSEGEDLLVDCLRLGDFNVIYGETSTWEMHLAGAPLIFSFKQRFPQSGLLAQGCGVNVLNRHFVVTNDDIILHDLSRIESIADLRIRQWFFKNLNRMNAGITRVTTHIASKEVWILFSTEDAPVHNLALVWNWVFNTWSIKDLPGTLAAASIQKVIDLTGTWTEVAGDWDSQTSTWNAIAGVVGRHTGSLYLASNTDSEILLVDNELCVCEAGSYESFVEREGLAFLVNSRTGELYYDFKRLKMLLAVYPHIEAPVGATFTLSVRVKDTLLGPYGAAQSVQWIAGTDTWKSIFITGRFLSVKISDNGGENAWSLLGYDLDLVPLGDS